MNNPKDVIKFVFKNKQAIEESQTCGCYYCCETFSKEDITEWTDNKQTAICPKCSVDAVLPQSAGIPLDRETLKKLHDYWFTVPKSSV